jgi:7-keto-8-aminopelargonate synthetase-like enzyme
MYSKEVKEYLRGQLKSIKDSGLYKEERIICSPQGARIKVKEGEVLNLCANNYSQGAGKKDLRVSKDRGHAPLFFLCCRQRRPVRGFAWP